MVFGRVVLGKCRGMAENRLKMAEKWLKMTEKWLKMVEKRLKMAENDQNGLFRPKMNKKYMF